MSFEDQWESSSGVYKKYSVVKSLIIKRIRFLKIRNMKKIFIFSLLLGWSLNLFASISIISDLDDTIKITNSGTRVRAAANAIGKFKTFTAIPELFKAFEMYTNDLYILSASPSILQKKISSDLKGIGILPKKIILRKWSRFEEKYEYKIREIEEILRHSSDQFILLGDDIGADPEVYSDIKKLYPERIIAVYIHVIENRKIPSNVISYWTTHEVAIRENLQGRMQESFVFEVIEKTKLESDFYKIIPRFAHCPYELTTWEWIRDTAFKRSMGNLSDVLTLFCGGRVFDVAGVN
jgi:hypothetical protein